MTILGIDTSCDETAMAVLEEKEGKFKVLSNIVSSQVKLHQKYGGVYPSLAKREHKKNLPIVFKKALEKAGLEEVDYFAVTIGPGLDPCLWEGINFIKKRADKPIIPINHMEAHILINFLEEDYRKILPALSLVISGGHSQLVLVKEIGNYKIIGETRDDAAGECFDKTARILGLPYPGGPAIAEEAEKESSLSIDLPRPMINTKDYDFSFSGLKTAVLYDFKKRNKEVRESKEYIRAMAGEIQQAIVDVLIKKTLKAAREYEIKNIILAGGVSANKKLGQEFKKNKEFKFWIPQPRLCTDNGLMIALTGFFNKDKAVKDFREIKSNPNLRLC